MYLYCHINKNILIKFKHRLCYQQITKVKQSNCNFDSQNRILNDFVEVIRHILQT